MQLKSALGNKSQLLQPVVQGCRLIHLHHLVTIFINHPFFGMDLISCILIQEQSISVCLKNIRNYTCHELAAHLDDELSRKWSTTDFKVDLSITRRLASQQAWMKGFSTKLLIAVCKQQKKILFGIKPLCPLCCYGSLESFSHSKLATLCLGQRQVIFEFSPMECCNAHRAQQKLVGAAVSLSIRSQCLVRSSAVITSLRSAP